MQADIVNSNLATKENLAKIELKIAAIELKIANVEKRLVMWFVGVGLAIIGVTIATSNEPKR